MTTVYRGTTYGVPTSLGGTIPGDAATGHLMRDVRGFVANLAPQNTPILDAIMKNSKGVKAGTQAKLEWGSGANLPHNAAVGAGAYTSGATTLNVATGQGARFQQWHKLAIYDLDANGQPDLSTKMVAVVNGEPNADALPIAPAQGGTSNRSFAAGARVEIIGVALPEGGDFTVAPEVYGDWYNNYYQLYEKSAIVTFEGDVTPNYEFQERELARQIRDKTMRLKLEQEKDLIQGGKQAGDLTTSPKTPSMLGGIDGFVPSANTVNLAGFRVTPYDIETEGAALWDSVGDAAAKKLLMSMRTARMFDGEMNKYREATMDSTSVNLQFKGFQTRVGTYDIVPTRWVPEGVIYGVNFDNLYLIPYAGMDWQEKEHATDGAYKQRSIFGKFTLKVESPETIFKLYGFDTNINNYSRVF